MAMKNPTRGLLMYSFYSLRGNISIGLSLILALGIVLLITGNITVYVFFVVLSIGYLPFLVMMAMTNKKSQKWEKFQISMPVKRKNVVANFYLSISIASIAGLLLCAIILGIGIIIHENVLIFVIEGYAGHPSSIFGAALIAAGLFLPIGSTKVGADRGEVFFTICMLVAFFSMLLVSMIGESAGISLAIISLIQIGASAIVFIISYCVSCKIYAKLDF